MHNDASKYQLPKSVVPRHYDILVRPDFGSFRFSGRVAVDVEVREPVSRIIVNSLGLKITEAHVVDGKGKRLDAVTTHGRRELRRPHDGRDRRRAIRKRGRPR